MSTTRTVFFKEWKRRVVGRRLPWDVELLFMNDLVAVHDLFGDLLSLRFIHSRNILDTNIVSLNEVFKLCL